MKLRYQAILPIGLPALILTVLMLGIVYSQRGIEAQQPPTPVDPGPGTEYIDPDLWGLLQRHANGEAGLSTSTRVSLGYRADKETEVIAAIASAGGSSVGQGNLNSDWSIPTGSVLSIIQRPDVYSATLIEESSTSGPSGVSGTTTPTVVPRAKMDDTLTRIFNAYQAGIPANQAVLYALFIKDGNALVFIQAPNAGTEAQIRSWLKARGVYAPPDITRSYTDHNVAVLLPAADILPLAQRFTNVWMSVESIDGQGLPLTRSRWPQDSIDFEQDIVSEFLEPDGSATTTPSQPGAGGTSGTTRRWETDLPNRLSEHGASRWHSAEMKGRGVKVGIIDWGFRGLNNDPDLTDLDKVSGFSDLTGNAYCQSVGESVWPLGQTLELIGSECEPGRGAAAVNHGVNVAEIVNDIAPHAKLFYAQANSPRQLYRASDWLTRQNVDVIVNAGGWPYDGPGDGTSPFGTSTYITNPNTDDTDEHSVYRYYPSPLNTVDHFVNETSGPVWINAAGNAENVTMWLNSPTLFSGSRSSLTKYIHFNDSVSGQEPHDDLERICQRITRKTGKIYIYSMRWADTWPTGQYDLQFFTTPITSLPTATGRGSFADSVITEQFPAEYPVRHVSKSSAASTTECLRIRVDSSPTGSPAVPEWIQFQILTTDQDMTNDWNKDISGRSIVNPASSNNPGLLAVGAKNLRSTSTTDVLMNYSSRGPVFSQGARSTSTPSRIKPDVSAGSGAATHTKWKRECSKINQPCGEGLYFGGTSAATSHTGGLAALVVQWFKSVGLDYTPADIADFLKKSGQGQGSPTPNNDWGHGSIKLPCPSKKVPHLPYSISTDDANWSADDCVSTRRSSSPNYVDYYTFTLPATTTLQIDLISEERRHLYLINGLYTGGRDWAWSTGSGPTATTTRIDAEDLAPGSYTVAATTRDRNTTSTYQLSIHLGSSTPAPQPKPAPTPTPTPTSTPTPTPTPTPVCEPLSNFTAYRTSARIVIGTWTNPTTGLTATNKKVDIERKEGSNWVHHQVINQMGPAYVEVLHYHSDQSNKYRYRVRNECGSSYSSYTSWVEVSPWSSGSSGSSGDDHPEPTPTPVPSGPGT